MTATIHQFTPRSKLAPITITRTPELAFVMAIVRALPEHMQERCLHTVKQLAALDPECDASREAAKLADMLSKAGRV